MTDTVDNAGPRKYVGNTRGRPFEKDDGRNALHPLQGDVPYAFQRL